MKTLLFLLLIPTISFSAVLPNFLAVKTTIKNGQPISVVTKLENCSPTANWDRVISPKNIMVTKSEIAFSTYHLTFFNHYYPNKAVGEETSYQLNQNGNLTITSLLIDANTMKKLNGYQPPITICTINKGVIFATITMPSHTKSATVE